MNTRTVDRGGEPTVTTVTTVSTGPAAPARLDAVLQMLASVVTSAEPAVVFTSVAALCVATLYSAATLSISESGGRAYRIAYPQGEPERGKVRSLHAVEAHEVVSAEIDSPATDTHKAYRGTLELHYDRSGTAAVEAVLARLIVDRAVAAVALERAADVADEHRMRAENLDKALSSNRAIGVAIGIIMSNHKITADEAFDLMSRVSQHTQRKMRDLALDVASTGMIDVPDAVTHIRLAKSADTRGNSRRESSSHVVRVAQLHPRGGAPRVAGPPRPRATRPQPDADDESGVPFRVAVDQASARVEVAGELDLLTAPSLLDAVKDIGDVPELTIDLQRVTFLGAAGLNALIAIHDAPRTAPRALTITGLSPWLARVFRLGRAERLLRTSPDRNALDLLAREIVVAVAQDRRDDPQG